MLAVAGRGLSMAGLDRLALAARAADLARHEEPELRLLPRLVDRQRAAIDVGAAEGVYAWALTRLVRSVIAFEPHPVSCARLKRALPQVQVHALALSDRRGSSQLRIPVRGRVAASGWGTIHDANDLVEASPERIASFEVERAPLDELGISNVGFMKIDVEGHELAVLEGARRLLMRDRPALLIEVGTGGRGAAPADVFRLLASLGYRAEALDAEGALTAVDAIPAGRTSINVVARPC